MPYVAPTIDQFITKFPTFQGLAETYGATVQAALDEAGSSVDTSWVERDYQPAIMYLAAHILTIDGAVVSGSDIGAAGGIIAAGLVSEMKVGDVQVKLAGASSGSGSASGATGYRSTAYGLRYLELLRRNQSGPILV